MITVFTPHVFASDFSNKSCTAYANEVQSIVQPEDIRENGELNNGEFVKSDLERDIINDPTKGVDELQNVILETDTFTEGMATKREINYINDFKTAIKLKYPEMSDFELGKTILTALGDSEDFIATLPEDKIIEALGYTSAVKTESFFEQNPDDEIIEMNESVFYNEIYGPGIPPTVYDKPETLDSYVKLTSTAYKTNPSYALPGRNYFTICGAVEWTKTPAVQGKDILAIASSGNVDHNYTAFAYGSWTNLGITGFDDTAYIGENGGKGDHGEALKIYNPSIYGIAVDVRVRLTSPGPTLKNVYAYYGISTQNDVSCQVAYAHKTVGIGDPSVSIDGSGSVSFSIGIISTMNDYFGQIFTLYHESYTVLLDSPSMNASVSANSTPPTFQWTMQNGSTQNFILEIDYLNNGSYMSIPVQNARNYTLSSNEWNAIINNSPFTYTVKDIRWRIRINYIIYPDLQPYRTEWSTFSITGVPLTTQETLPTIYGNTRYTEKAVNIGAGGYQDFIVTFAAGGNKLIQTFGLKDTKLELYSAGGTLLASNDDGGYSYNALMNYNVSANTQYKIRIKFWSPSVYGDTKIAIVSTYNYATYEDIYYLHDYTMGLTWSFAQNNVKLMTYEYSTTRYLTMHVSSDVDTYLYIIDPRSAELMVPASNSSPTTTHGIDNLYNDDYNGTRDSQITKTFDAGVPYLVIVSAYNPSLSTSVGSFYVDFPGLS